MATSADTMRFFADQLEACGLGVISYRKMFGEYGVYLNAQIFALACDDTLFFKVKHLPDATVDELFGNRNQPFQGANGYAEVPVDALEDIEALERRLRTVIATLPEPKPKKPKRAKAPKA
jgi:TfoX/Sxy family transcriptional regulator of competence genes